MAGRLCFLADYLSSPHLSSLNRNLKSCFTLLMFLSIHFAKSYLFVILRYVLRLHIVSGYTKTITGDELHPMLLVLFNNVYTFQGFVFIKCVMNPSKIRQAAA